MQGVRRSAQHCALLARQLSHSFASSTGAAAAKGSAPAFASVDALRAQLESGAGACVDEMQHNAQSAALYHLCKALKVVWGYKRTSSCAGPNFTDFLPASKLPDQYSVYAPNWKARLLAQCGG